MKTMWKVRNSVESNGRVARYRIDRDSAPISFAEAIHGWQYDPAFRQLISQLLVDSPFTAFRWETPPLSTATLGQAFEFVLVDSPDLKDRADPSAFAEHFLTATAGEMIEFANLGGDAILVVPCPQVAVPGHAHLASFLRRSGGSQQHALWQALAVALRRRLDATPVWTSTAGGGVAWLHLRLDDCPKYYAYGPYRNGL